MQAEYVLNLVVTLILASSATLNPSRKLFNNSIESPTCLQTQME